MKARKGFTLLELMGVVLVLAVLAGIMVPRILDCQKDAKRARCNVNIRDLKKAIERYAADNQGDYPAVIGDITGDRYFPHGGPKCPYDDLYVFVPSAPTAGEGTTITDHDHTND